MSVDGLGIGGCALNPFAFPEQAANSSPKTIERPKLLRPFEIDATL
jgi:hypothetical protein